MTVVIHLMFGCMFCHIFSLCHLSPAPQHAGKPTCDHVINFSYNFLLTHFTRMDFPLVGHNHLNGTSFFCLKAFNTLSIHGLQNDGDMINDLINTKC